MIRPATAEDCDEIAAIYDDYVRQTVVTFEESPVSGGEIARRMEKVRGLGLPYLVLEQEKQVRGYAYAGRWHERSAYRFTAETTIYLDAQQVGRGLGTTLYTTLLEQLRALGLHTAIGSIALPNPGSVALHEKLGFRQVAHHCEVGFKQGRWVDVGHWQLLF